MAIGISQNAFDLHAALKCCGCVHRQWHQREEPGENKGHERNKKSSRYFPVSLDGFEYEFNCYYGMWDRTRLAYRDMIIWPFLKHTQLLKKKVQNTVSGIPERFPPRKEYSMYESYSAAETRSSGTRSSGTALYLTVSAIHTQLNQTYFCLFFHTACPSNPSMC